VKGGIGWFDVTAPSGFTVSALGEKQPTHRGGLSF
jgi:hypothetical protein